jgi:pheromone shutdown-related protein TraB
MKHKNLVLLGTSHIARQSLNEVEAAVKKEKPGIIALELDRKRMAALLEKKRPRLTLKDIKRVGIKGFLFSIIGAWAEKKLGEKTGIKPGAEMKRAYELARENKIDLAMIDQDIEVTLRKISQKLTWREKLNFFADVFKAVVLRKREVIFDLSKVPSARVIKRLTSKVKKRYPHIYEVLVEERNMVMAKNIAKLCRMNPEKKVLAIIGAGHEKEILDIVKEEQKKPSISYSITIS